MDFANAMMEMKNGLSILSFQRDCIERFGEEYPTMQLADWYKVIKEYLEGKTLRYELKPEEVVYWNVAEPDIEL